MSKQNKKEIEIKKFDKLNIIWIWFAVFCMVFLGLVLAIKDPKSANSLCWIALEMSVLAIDVILLIIYKLPSKEKIFAAVILALLVLTSYVDISIVNQVPAWFNLVVDPLLTLLSALTCFTAFEKYPQKSGRIFKQHGVEPILISILIGGAVGLVWGIINIYLMLSGNQSNIQFSLHNIMVALSPAIFEEIALRTTFWALCLFLSNGKEQGKKQQFTCIFMMIVPHVLIHTPAIFIAGGWVNGLVAFVLYIVLYGVVFAFLQKKRDLASAMIAHGVVDFMRFCFYGIPL